MAAVMEAHMDGRRFLVGDRVTVADIVAAYTLDLAAVSSERSVLDDLPHLHAFMDRMYARPNAVPRIADAFASLRLDDRKPS
jgi:glutathione S-transferase